MLREGKDTFAFIYPSDEAEGETIRKEIMPVNKRQKPEDYPEEESGNQCRSLGAWPDSGMRELIVEDESAEC